MAYESGPSEFERQYIQECGANPWVLYAHVVGPTVAYVKWLEKRAAQQADAHPDTAQQTKPAITPPTSGGKEYGVGG